jgi:hypothetical protein
VPNVCRTSQNVFVASQDAPGPAISTSKGWAMPGSGCTFHSKQYEAKQMPHEIEGIFKDAIVKYREGEKQHGRCHK